MDEIIVRVARTVACSSRLRIMSCLLSKKQATPTEMARDLGMAVDMVSTHLRRLSAVGLVRTRRSGAKCFCVFQSTYSSATLSGRVCAWLRDALTDPKATLKNCGVGQLCNFSDRDATLETHRLLFEAATAFTDLRRLQILRLLADRSSATVQEMTSILRMSDYAACRQTRKLVRRGYLEAQREGRIIAYRLSRQFKTPVHARLLAIVRREWERE